MEGKVLVMQSLVKKAQDHLERNHMTYLGHMKFASCHGLICIKAGIMLCIHSLFPCFFERAGTKLVRLLKLSFDKRHKEKIMEKT